jgi:UDP-2,4-diacetamido-2,4,6-trideoxy-beta-L-altropyranose hydrolase
MIPGTLLIRADASIPVGTGHVMRCLALTQAWQDVGGGAVFAMAESTPSIRARVASETCAVESVSAVAGTQDDASRTIVLARERQAEWIVVDGYQFGADYQRALKAAGLRVLFLDDYGHARHYSADLVLNQNVCASTAIYRDRDAQTRLLLGPRYCLLRREFARWRNWNREISSSCHRVLIMMGGSDPENLTARAIEALALGRVEGLEATVIIGGSSPHFAAINLAAARSGLSIKVQKDVSDIAEFMAVADVAVSAAGSTCWELCLLGLPALLVDVASNQTALAMELDRRGCAVHAGDRTVPVEKLAAQLKRLIGSGELRQSLSRRSRELVDGNGARRVASVLRGTEGWQLRRVRADDRELLWEWANDPEVRAASFSSAPIPWETHVAWFAEKFGQGRSIMLIAEDEKGAPFGQIRFDFKSDGEAELNISLARESRGCGLGVRVIEAGVRELYAAVECLRVNAFVKPENAASARAFEQAHFVRVGTERVRGNDAVHYVYRRN